MAELTGESVFKVLSGNQFGAEVVLSDGTYSFGAGGEADIQLDDVALEPIHGYVRLRDGKVELRAAQGDLVTASNLSLSRGDESWHEIAQMDAVSAGLSKFVIAGPKANWSAFAQAAPTAPVKKPSSGAFYSMVSAVPRRAIYAAGSVLAVVVLAGVIGGFGSDAAQRSAADMNAEALSTLRATVSSMPFARDVSIIERADGTIAIEGYVEEQVERRAIQNSLDESGLAATLRVYVRENLRADVQGTIDSLQVPAAFQLDDTGNLTLTGTILDPATAERLVEGIETGVFGLASVRSEIRTADAILADLRTIAGDAGLADLVIFRLDDLVVEATGIVPRDKMDNWVGLIGVYSRRFANEIPLRSFVTLDQPAAEDTAPVIIGSGPLADAEQGRVVAPETLSEPNEVDAQSLFAGDVTPNVTPNVTADQTLPDSPLTLPDSGLENLSAAIERLREIRPDLHERLLAEVSAGQVPDSAVLQEALQSIGGTLQQAPGGNAGSVQVVVEGLGPIGTVDGLAEDLRRLAGSDQASPQPQDAAGPVAALPPLQGVSPADIRIGEIEEVAQPEEPGAGSASTAALVPIQAAAVAAASTAATPQAGGTITQVADEATVVDEPAVETADVVRPTLAEAAKPLEETASLPSSAAGEAPITLPLFALPQSEMTSVLPLIDAANAVIEREEAEGAGGAATISPNLLALVAMQNEQLQFGKTLMRLPQPLSAIPYPVEQSIVCWDGSTLTPGMLPTALLLLDSLSVSTSSDVTELTPNVRDVVMQIALSPERVKSCLRQTGTTFGEMVGGSSTFLSETERNPDFVEFLFRNVPKSALQLEGASLVGARYVELADGRKLGEGAAPDVTSRITSIGDLGILLRTADGTQVQLYGNTLGWLVAESCSAEECGTN